MADTMLDPSRMNSISIDSGLMDVVLTATSNHKHVFSFGHARASKLVESCARLFRSILRGSDHPDVVRAVERLQAGFMAWGHEVLVFDKDGGESEEGKEVFDNYLDNHPQFSKDMQMDLDALYVHLSEVWRMLDGRLQNTPHGKATLQDPVILPGQDVTRDTTPGIGPRSRLGLVLSRMIPMRLLLLQLRYADYSSNWDEGVIPRISDKYLLSVLCEPLV
ncbi:hypothetical protein BDP55DRAFT_709791 [Colletotrichum godetiae]|uniref:Uncharacterized protein n=1 Tax=Colletotrichum godetiae TaxID=1209918 RepID=A0AAJ0EZP3_9PEZI|nr:uncharacterized protein BDP55DRAFT_709791 [Colletotrichum godetiae]KAK1701504.1 hypothetical protein BDP55DRAFT_709791 [Colletotrichum godetiae]